MSTPTFQRAPWVKRIELSSGAVTAHPLDETQPFPTATHERGGRAFRDHFEFDGHAWHHVGHRWPGRQVFDDGDDDEANEGSAPVVDRRWALHGTSATSGTALYLFMEYPEARHPELEAALTQSPQAVMVYADWLEEQGDPYAASLNPALLKERGPAGQWFLEGLDRGGTIHFELDGGLVRTAQVNETHQLRFDEVLVRLTSMRAALSTRCPDVEVTSVANRRRPRR